MIEKKPSSPILLARLNQEEDFFSGWRVDILKDTSIS